MNVLLLSAVFASILGFAPLRAAAQQSDADLIRELQTRQADAWNRHDAAAFARLFTDDGDVVNVLGWWWKNPAEIRGKLEDAFAFVFRDSALTITDVQIRFLQPTIAVAHVWWTMDGAKAPPGAPAPPRRGVQLQVLSKQSGRWLIASFQNTNSVPETPFPKAPAGAKP
jgi:uncharacterized protein (TIGR02246 family)